jgi:hypothetical protein
VDRNLESKANASAADFLHTELEISNTFADIALGSRNAIRIATDRRNARTGYDTVVRLVARLELTAEDVQIVGRKLALLKSKLIRLGESSAVLKDVS